MATPFRISPNPTSLYLTDSLKGILHKCRYTIDERQGLSCILGNFGLGKSTVLRYLQAEYDARDDCNTALIATPIYPSAFAFLKGISIAFKLEPARSFQAQMKLLETFLTEQFLENKNNVIFIDEAQILDTKQLELIRAILNFETNEEKLVQVILGSQIELTLKLNHKKNLALKSRITTYSELKPLTETETGEAINARCQIASIANPFTPAHVAKIHELTGGVPRSVIKLCGLIYSMQQSIGAEEIPLEWISGFTAEVGL